jgi:hypothetical protein
LSLPYSLAYFSLLYLFSPLLAGRYSLRNGWILNSHGEIAYVAHTDEGSSLAPSDSIPSTPPPPPPSKEIAARINNIVNLVHSKFTGNREETPKLKALTIDALKQQEEQRKQNEMIIVRTIRGDEIHGHPSYEVPYPPSHLLSCLRRQRQLSTSLLSFDLLSPCPLPLFSLFPSPLSSASPPLPALWRDRQLSPPACPSSLKLSNISKTIANLPSIFPTKESMSAPSKSHKVSSVVSQIPSPLSLANATLCLPRCLPSLREISLPSQELTKDLLWD